MGRDEKLLVGAIGVPVGLKGEVKLLSYTEIPAAIANYAPLVTEGERELQIVALRTNAAGLVARFEGIETREQAEALKGRKLFVARAALPAPGRGEFYHADLIGLEAVAVSGERLGKVIAVRNYGAGDLLEIRLASENRSALVPFTNAVVPRVDLARARLTIDPPPGLLDDTAPERDANEE